MADRGSKRNQAEGLKDGEADRARRGRGGEDGRAERKSRSTDELRSKEGSRNSREHQPKGTRTREDLRNKGDRAREESRSNYDRKEESMKERRRRSRSRSSADKDRARSSMDKDRKKPRKDVDAANNLPDNLKDTDGRRVRAAESGGSMASSTTSTGADRPTVPGVGEESAEAKELARKFDLERSRNERGGRGGRRGGYVHHSGFQDPGFADPGFQGFGYQNMAGNPGFQTQGYRGFAPQNNGFQNQGFYRGGGGRGGFSGPQRGYGGRGFGNEHVNIRFGRGNGWSWNPSFQSTPNSNFVERGQRGGFGRGFGRGGRSQTNGKERSTEDGNIVVTKEVFQDLMDKAQKNKVAQSTFKDMSTAEIPAQEQEDSAQQLNISSPKSTETPKKDGKGKAAEKTTPKSNPKQRMEVLASVMGAPKKKKRVQELEREVRDLRKKADLKDGTMEQMGKLGKLKKKLKGRTKN